MEFLKKILGDDLYKQVETAISDYNNNETNADNKIKLVNIKSGGYVSKGKYDTLNSQLTSKLTELETANTLISDLKNTNNSAEIESKIQQYETDIEQLKNQLYDTKLKAAVKVALLSEKAIDVDYLAFKLEQKLKEENKTLELDDDGNIRNFDDTLSNLKVRFPNQFESSSHKKIEENKLANSDENNVITKSDILKKPYLERLKLKQDNPEVYNEAMKQ